MYTTSVKNDTPTAHNTAMAQCKGDCHDSDHVSGLLMINVCQINQIKSDV